MLKKVLLYSLFIISITSAWGQSTNITTFFKRKEKKADEIYSTKAYRNALEIYLRIAEKDGSNVHAKMQIADCYLHLNDPVSAEFWYRSLVTDPDIDPHLKLKLAEVLCMNSKYSEAVSILKSIPKDKADSTFITRQIKFIENIHYFLRDSLLYTIGNAEGINSPFSDFGATFYKKNHIVFASTRDHDLFIKSKSVASPNPDEAMTSLFEADEDVTAEFKNVRLFKNDKLKSSFHDGPLVFYDDHTKVAFTRSNFVHKNGVEDANGSVNLKLYLAEVGPLGGLNNIHPFQHNSDGYSVGHATFTKDGKTIYFSSTYPLGYGGADIYYSKLNDDGTWSDPVNAGPSVNTFGNELYPHLCNDSTLYFSSNGQGGFGGLDVYYSKKRKGKFTTPQNLGYSINSANDDFSMVTDHTGKQGFFASNRPGGKGDDDLYRFIMLKTFLQGQALERGNLKFIPDAKIIVTDEFGNVMDSTRTDSNGNFHLDLPFEENMIISAKKDGYEMLEGINFSTMGQPFGIDSLILPMWKHALFAKGRIFSNEAQAILPGATVYRKDLTTDKIDTVVVSENGQYGFVVIPNHKYRIEAKKFEHITNGFNLNTENLFEGDLLNDIVLEEIYIEKSVPLFDLNKSDIRQEAFNGLDKIVRTLKKYPTTTLNIGAHADSRGTHAYNKRLSAQRAETVVKYFVDKGITRQRIDSQAFGEELILNRCSDGVICSEAEHSKNRRVEIKVQHKPIE